MYFTSELLSCGRPAGTCRQPGRSAGAILDTLTRPQRPPGVRACLARGRPERFTHRVGQGRLREPALVAEQDLPAAGDQLDPRLILDSVAVRQLTVAVDGHRVVQTAVQSGQQ